MEEEAGQLKEMNGDIHREVELCWRERENSTVFVIPETARTSDGHHTWMYLKGTDPDTATLGSVSDLHDGDTTTLDSSSEDTLSRDLERVSLGSLGKWTWDIHSIILDFSTANFIDTVAIKTLRNVSSDSKVPLRKVTVHRNRALITISYCRYSMILVRLAWISTCQAVKVGVSQ